MTQAFSLSPSSPGSRPSRAHSIARALLAQAAPSRRMVWPLAAAAGCAAGALALAQALRVRAAMDAAARARLRAYQRRVHGASVCVWVLGDSTGVGLGCGGVEHSLAGRLAADHPHAEVINACVNGDRLRDVLRRVRARGARWPRPQLVLLQAGGNDILRGSSATEVARDAAALLAELRGLGAQVLWAGVPNVGRAPLFIAPFSWWVTWRTWRLTRAMHAAAREAGVEFVDFFHPGAGDHFSSRAGRYYADDGLHPSAAAHALCWRLLRPRLKSVLAAPVPPSARPSEIGPSVGV